MYHWTKENISITLINRIVRIKKANDWTIENKELQVNIFLSNGSMSLINRMVDICIKKANDWTKLLIKLNTKIANIYRKRTTFSFVFCLVLLADCGFR